MSVGLHSHKDTAICEDSPWQYLNFNTHLHWRKHHLLLWRVLILPVGLLSPSALPWQRKHLFHQHWCPLWVATPLPSHPSQRLAQLPSCPGMLCWDLLRNKHYHRIIIIFICKEEFVQERQESKFFYWNFLFPYPSIVMEHLRAL